MALVDSPAYSQNNGTLTRHAVDIGQAILQTHVFTTPMLDQRRKRWPNIVSTLGQRLVFVGKWPQYMQ